MILARRRSRTRSDDCLPPFTSEAETDLVSLDGHVPVLQRGQAIAVVLPGVIVIPYTYQRGLQEMHDGCNNFFPRQTAQCHVLAYCFPNGRQGVCKCDHMLVLRAFRTSRKARMVTILLATLCVTAGCLDMAIRRRVAESRPRLLAPNTGPFVGNITQARYSAASRGSTTIACALSGGSTSNTPPPILPSNEPF
jgi:hypothetical protein